MAVVCMAKCILYWLSHLTLPSGTRGTPMECPTVPWLNMKFFSTWISKVSKGTVSGYTCSLIVHRYVRLLSVYSTAVVLRHTLALVLKGLKCMQDYIQGAESQGPSLNICPIKCGNVYYYIGRVLPPVCSSLNQFLNVALTCTCGYYCSYYWV